MSIFSKELINALILKKSVDNPPINSMDIDEGPPSSEITKMVVLDGIVMGPTVSLNIIYIYIYIYIHSHKRFSIVHLKVVQVNWLMHVGVLFFRIMKLS